MGRNLFQHCILSRRSICSWVLFIVGTLLWVPPVYRLWSSPQFAKAVMVSNVTEKIATRRLVEEEENQQIITE